MESLLDSQVPDHDLDKAIQNTTNLATLDALFGIKQKRLEDHGGDKVKFSISRIFEEENQALASSILKKALLTVQNCDEQIKEAVELSTAENQKADLKTLQMLSVFLEFTPTIIKTKAAQIRSVILSVFNEGPSELYNFIMVHFLPKYLEVDISAKFANQIFYIIKTSKHLEMLCYLYKHLLNIELLKRDEYWVFLHETLSVKDLRKQSAFLLYKSIEKAFSLKCFQSQYLELNYSVVETEKAWKDFFILLDISNEKQLHLVEPSLQLLDSIQCLHHSWQICLYKNLLCHTQTAVVYSVALHLLQNNQLEKDYFPFDDLLVAVNRNEYSTLSDEVFEAITGFCKRTGQFELVLLESINVTWNPVAAWCFYNNIFSSGADFQISPSLSEKIIHKLKSLPNIFIRESCIRVVCEYVTQYFSSESVAESLKIAFLLKYLGYCDLFSSFISKHRFGQVELENVIEATVHDESPNIEFLVMLFEVFKHLNLPYSVFRKIVNDSELLGELRFMIWPELVEEKDLEDYIVWCIRSPDNAPDIRKYFTLNKVFFLNFFRECCQSEALSVLCKFRKYKAFSSRDIQTLYIVSEILRTCNCNDIEPVTDLYLDRFLNSSGKIEEPIVTCFLDSFFKTQPFGQFRRDTIEETIFVLNNVLDLNYISTLPLIFEKLCIFYDHKNYEHLVRPLVDRCFVELKKLAKNNSFLRCARIFFNAILNFTLWNHDRMTDEFKYQICSIFFEAVNSIAKDKNEMAFILVSSLSTVVHNFPGKCFKLIESIVELVLRTGAVFRRSERVEHAIYHEISQRLPRADPSNPIWIDSATKLRALDLMLGMAKDARGAADEFISVLLEKYMQHFNKRYFPDSQIHIEKLRIIQAMLLLHPYIQTSKEKVINFIAESFLSESHQPSVRHLMQWLLILLLSEDGIAAVDFISDKLKAANNSRPTSVAAFIPVLYHLCLHQEEAYWKIVVDNLLPYTMGAQFKLRAFSQAVIKKLYEEARKMNFQKFTNNYIQLYNSVNSVIVSSGDPFHDVVNLENDFLLYFDIFEKHQGIIFLNIYYFIPERCEVTATEWRHISDKYRDIFKVSYSNNLTHPTEWQHLSDAYRNNFVFTDEELRHIAEDFTNLQLFERILPPKITTKLYSESKTGISRLNTNDNVQRKITPWKSALEEDICSVHQTDLMLITSLLEKNTNLGGLMRTCEVFGVKQMVMKTAKVLSDKEFKSLSMSSENWVDIVEVKAEDLRAFILTVKTKGYRVVGAEQTTNSVQLDQFRFPQKTVLLLGNEKEGIPPDLIAVIDDFVEIPQFGVVRSLNVHVAGAIVIWEYRKQHSV